MATKAAVELAMLKDLLADHGFVWPEKDALAHLQRWLIEASVKRSSVILRMGRRDVLLVKIPMDVEDAAEVAARLGDWLGCHVVTVPKEFDFQVLSREEA
jgi:hypothetical protein